MDSAVQITPVNKTEISSEQCSKISPLPVHLNMQQSKQNRPASLLRQHHMELLEQEALYGPAHLKVAEVQSKIALFYQHMECDLEKSLVAHTGALHTLRACSETNERNIAMAVALTDIGNVYQQLHRNQEALAAYREAVSHFVQVDVSPFHPAKRSCIASIDLLTRSHVSTDRCYSEATHTNFTENSNPVESPHVCARNENKVSSPRIFSLNLMQRRISSSLSQTAQTATRPRKPLSGILSSAPSLKNLMRRRSSCELSSPSTKRTLSEGFGTLSTSTSISMQKNDTWGTIVPKSEAPTHLRPQSSFS